ncbi:HlyC/CorC family transporter [Egibacter rhizosphaerae]|uniref:HlyC/CorC family transporter n=1 Tax=Egibacter rhizosphaerae TaxID=1670831 RepID=A0A411YLM6_9ACTN|nr:HlyC/CorC family transporter [Egibacter rhizosphaerae]
MQLGAAAELGLGLGAVAVLILLNGYFVAAEFAYVAVRRTRLAEAASAGDRVAERALRVLGRLSFMLSGAQLGITATSLLVGFIAEPTLGRAVRPLLDAVGLPQQTSIAVSLGVGLIVATGVQMVLGELAPKNLAIARPEPLARGLSGITLVFLTVAGPVIRVFDGASNLFLRLVRVEPAQELHVAVSSEELERIIATSGEQGSLTQTQTALLDRALDFQELDAEAAMVPRPHVSAIQYDASGADLLEAVRSSGHSRLLVTDGGLDNVRGVVQVKDLLRVRPEERATTPVAHLAADPVVVPETAPLPTLLGQLRAAHTQLAVVVDEHGGTAGVVTLEDIVEELVGDIRDEHDPTEAPPRQWPDGSMSLPGSWRVDEAERAAGLTLPVGDYDTVSGLVMAQLDRIPQPGDVIDVAGARLFVERVDGHAVGSVRLTATPPEGPENAGGPEDTGGPKNTGGPEDTENAP